MNNKNLSRIDKRVKKGVLINKGITAAEGTLLGILGIGIPDIPVFIGVILKTVYEICVNYGFDYKSKSEKAFILNIICASSIKTDEKFYTQMKRIELHIVLKIILILRLI